MVHKKKNKKQYFKPTITMKKLVVSLFSKRNYDFDLLATCSFCHGDTCPDGCSTTCFVSGTKILADKEYKHIETLKIGDKITAYNFSKNSLVTAKIAKVIIGTSTHLIKINNCIEVTPEHRFWINSNKWTRAKNIKLGSSMFNSKGAKIPILSLELKEKVVPVFNLHLTGRHHTYFAEDVLVHNWK